MTGTERSRRSREARLRRLESSPAPSVELAEWKSVARSLGSVALELGAALRTAVEALSIVAQRSATIGNDRATIPASDAWRLARGDSDLPVSSQKEEKRGSPQDPPVPDATIGNDRATIGNDRTVTPSSDGAFGMTGPAWADGIRKATGKPCTPPRGQAQVGLLLEALKTHKAPELDPVAWITDSAERFARANVGKVLSIFKWVDWLNSSESRTSGRSPFDSPGLISARRAREEADEQYQRAAVPPPAGALLGAIKAKARAG